jgi:hypothetical protein
LEFLGYKTCAVLQVKLEEEFTLTKSQIKMPQIKNGITFLNFHKGDFTELGVTHKLPIIQL